MPSKRAITAASVKKLKSMCGLDAEQCRESLQEANGDVGKALARLIDSGQVKYDQLDPDTVSDELFGRAYQRHLDALFTELPEPSGPLASGFPPGFHDVLRQFINRAAQVRRTGPGQTLSGSGAAAKHNVRTKRRQAALERNPVVLHLPPLPKLTLKLMHWAGEDFLKTWSGFGPKRGSKGKVALSIPRPPEDDDVAPAPPAPEMVAAYAHLKEHEPEVTAAVLEAFRSYIDDALIRKYKWDLDPVGDAKALKKRMELGSLTLLPVAKDGLAYVGMFFHCTWDPEHNAGALLHGSRVVKVGDNEAAVDTFSAEEDGGEEIRYEKRRGAR
jgi:hypothetical protein